MTEVERIRDEERDQELIDGLLHDDRDSLAAIYDAYSGPAYALAARTLGLTSEAEDVVQESFLALWRQAKRLDPAKGIRSYLMTIVHNKAIDRLRRKGRKPELALDPQLPIADERGGPEDAAVHAIDRERVRAALSALPSEQRQAVEMTYFGGLTISEAASRMKAPVGTVKSRLRLALARLRRELMEPA
jgi:RNA polymerase sigma-70 factor (ECF subfamily)